MKKQCGIVEDLLPLYHDGVCSAESRELVEAHLAQCEVCRKTLSRIDDELLAPAGETEVIDLLKGITKRISKEQRKALVKGIVITLAFLLLVFGYNAVLWYLQEYTFYAPFGENRSVTQVIPGAGRYHYWEDDTYQYTVVVPQFLSKSGHVSIGKIVRDERNQYIEYVEAVIRRQEDEKYVFTVNVLCAPPEKWHHLEIDADLNLYRWRYRHKSESEMAQIQTELEAHEEELQALVDAAKAAWPFIS